MTREESPGNRVLTILVVDDDPLAAWSFRRLLANCSVDIESSVGAGLEALLHHAYDAIIIDVHLGLDSPTGGLELAMNARTLRPEATIILTSAIHEKELEHYAQKAGADGWISKGDACGTVLRDLLAQLARSADRRLLPSAAEVERIHKGFGALIESVAEASTEERLVQARRAHKLALLAAAALAAPGDLSTRCAEAIGLSRTGLQAYALLTQFGPRELERLLVDTQDCNGKFPSVSHALQLAKLPKSVRGEWIRRMLTEGVPNVPDLEEQVRAYKRARTRDSSAQSNQLTSSRGEDGDAGPRGRASS